MSLLVLLVLFLYVPFIMIVEIPEVLILYVGKVSRNVRLIFALKILTTTLYFICFVGISYLIQSNYSWRIFYKYNQKLFVVLRLLARLLIVPFIEAMIYRKVSKASTKRVFLLTYLANLTSAWLVLLLNAFT